MKKQAVALALASVLALGIVGCGQQQPTASSQKQQTTQEQTQEQAPAKTEEKTETTTTTEAPAATTTETPAATTESNGQIGEAEAKRIALEDAGVAEQDTTGLIVKLDIDDGVTKYEVDFNVGTTEYDYDIHATTGAILERGMDVNDIDD